MSRHRYTTGKRLTFGITLIAACATVAAISVSSASPTRFDDRYGFPTSSLNASELFAAQKDGDTNVERFEEASYGVDPIITGPVSAGYKLKRQAAGCDNAVWPNVPKVCYPD